MQVVGVAKDSNTRASGRHRNLFLCAAASEFLARGGFVYPNPAEPGTMATALAREVHALDGNLALYEVITLQEQVDRSTSPQQWR